MFDGPTRMVPLQIKDNTISGFCLIGPEQMMHKCVFDTGAQFTAIPQAMWTQQFDREKVDADHFRTITRRSVFGHTCRAKRIPLLVAVMGDIDPEKLTGDGSEDAAASIIVDFGVCQVDLLFDGDAAKEGGASAFSSLKYVYIGLGGGTFKNGGLCINWAKPEAVLVEQLEPLNP